MEAMSRWLVGSSSRMMSGWPNSACASRILTFSLSLNVFIGASSSAESSPSPCSRRAASVSISQPLSSANSPSSSEASTPSSSEKSSLAYSASFCWMISYRRGFPRIMVSSTEYSSKAKWSCLSTDMRVLGSIATVPEEGSRSPDRMRRKVDFPAPFAPITP